MKQSLQTPRINYSYYYNRYLPYSRTFVPVIRTRIQSSVTNNSHVSRRSPTSCQQRSGSARIAGLHDVAHSNQTHPTTSRQNQCCNCNQYRGNHGHWRGQVRSGASASDYLEPTQTRHHFRAIASGWRLWSITWDPRERRKAPLAHPRPVFPWVCEVCG